MSKYEFTEKQALVGKLKEAGRSFKEIALLMEITPSAVRQHFVKYEIKQKKKRLIQDYTAGETMETLAERYGYSINTVKRVISNID